MSLTSNVIPANDPQQEPNTYNCWYSETDGCANSGPEQNTTIHPHPESDPCANPDLAQNTTIHPHPESDTCANPDLAQNTTICPRPWIRCANRIFAKYKGAADRLIAQRCAFATSSRQDRFFEQALQESFAFHFLHNSVFQAQCLANNVRPSLLKKLADFLALPALAPLVGQDTVLPSVSYDKILMYAPTDLPSAAGVPLDARSLRRLQRAVSNIGNTLKLNSRERANCLLLAPPPNTIPTHPHAWLLSLLIQFTKKRTLQFATPEDFCARLTEFASEGSALRLGAFLSDLLAIASANSNSKPHWNFPARSYAFCCGDWDERDVFLRHRSALANWLGLPEEHIRFVCTVPQQMMPYISCPAGNIHIPIYTRVLITDPQSGALLPAIESGRLHFLSPCISAGYATQVITNYRGHLEYSCPCGCRVPHIIVEGKQDIILRNQDE